MKQKRKPDLIWDECEIVDDEVDYLRGEPDMKHLSEDELRQIVYDDGDGFYIAWDFFIGELSDYLKMIDKKNNKLFKVKGVDMGWRNLEGHKTLNAENGEELLKGILPDTSEFSLYVWKEKTQLKIKCSHHDSPMGEWYFIKPLNKKELEEFADENY